MRRRPPASKPATPPRGLATAELLAKIDELDWEDTCPPLPPAPVAPVVAASPPPAPSRWLIPVLVAGLVLISIGLLALYQGWATDAPSPTPALANQAAVVPVVPRPVEATNEASAAADAARLAEVEAQERQRIAKLGLAVRQAEENAARKAAEKLRKAREEELARLEQEQQARQRQEEEARQRAEREAAEARARTQPPPQPKGPASPQELCADRSNFISRGLCESEACGQPEWLKHPFCVKRMEEQLRRVGGGH